MHIFQQSIIQKWHLAQNMQQCCYLNKAHRELLVRKAVMCMYLLHDKKPCWDYHGDRGRDDVVQIILHFFEVSQALLTGCSLTNQQLCYYADDQFDQFCPYHGYTCKILLP